jgi:hypothetical protein
VGDFGTILHTSNGGEAWGMQSSGTSNLLWSVYFADPAHGWISGEKGTILATENGGSNVDFINLKLSDASTMPIDSGIAPYCGNFMPYKPLSAFAGLEPTGPWVLSIYDGVDNNTGTLNAWSLKLYYEEAAVSSIFEQKTEQITDGVELYQNYPNPFHGQTYISYYLQESCDVEINIFEAEQATGKHQISWDASNYQSGIYIVQLKAGSQYLHK